MNPDAQGKVEVVAKSYVPETAVPIGLTPAETTRRAEAKTLREKYEATKGDDPYAALRAPEEDSDLSTLDIDKEVERRISESDPTLRDLRADAKAAANLVKTIAEQGIEGITDPSLQDQIIDDYIIKVLDIRPAFSSLSDAEKKAIARTELQRSDVRTKIGELLRRKLNPSVETETEEDRVVATKQNERAEKETAILAHRQQIDATDQQLTANNTLAARYMPADLTATPPTSEGDLLIKMREFRAGINTTRAAELRRDLATFYGKDRTQLERDKISIAQRIKDGEDITEATEIQIEELIELEAAQAGYQQLTTQRESIPQVDQALRAQRAEIEARLQTVIDEQVKLDSQINPLLQKRRAKEMAIVADIQRVVTQGGNAALTENVNTRVSILKTDTEEKAKATNDEDEQRLYNSLGSRWEIVVTRGGERFIEEVPGRVESDWEKALATGNVLSQVEDMLIRSLQINRRTDTREQLQHKISEAKRIREKLKADPEFAQLATSEYLTALIGRRLETGEPISEGEQRLMETYGWMDHISDYIDQKNQQDQEFKTRVENLIQQAGGDQEDKINTLKEKYGNNWATILAILLSGVAIPVGASSGVGFLDRLKKKIGR